MVRVTRWTWAPTHGLPSGRRARPNTLSAWAARGGPDRSAEAIARDSWRRMLELDRAPGAERLVRGSQAQVSYTWSRFKANDSMTQPALGPATFITDRDNQALDWGDAGAHRDHVLNTSLLWNLPTLESKGPVYRALLGDWALGGILIYSTGTPLTAYNGTVPGLPNGQVYGTGWNFNQRPMRVPSIPCGGTGQQIVDPAAFTLDGLRLGDTSQSSELLM